MFLNLLLKTILIYFTVLFLIRLMGKREIAQLSAFDLVVAIMLAELAVIPIENQDIPLYISVIPMFTLVGAEVVFSYACLKSRSLRRLINGSPSIIIADGTILVDEMRRLRYNIDDLLSQLRQKGTANISEVEYAILETSGELSVILKPSHRPVTTGDIDLQAADYGLVLPVISDGEVNTGNLQFFDVNKKWLERKLKVEYGLAIEDVFFAGMNKKRELLVSESKKKHGGLNNDSL